MVQNFAVFADRSASAKIKTAKIAASAISIAHRLPVRTGATKIKTAKFFWSPQRQFREILHPQKFPTIRYMYMFRAFYGSTQSIECAIYAI